MTGSIFVAMNCAFELRFRSLCVPGEVMSFPCDAQGRVPLDELSERERENYLYARAVMGREYEVPSIVRREDDCAAA